MQFHLDRPNEGLSVLRLVSEERHWELGIRPVQYGFRANLNWVKPELGNGRLGSGWYHVLDYCAGNNIPFALEILGAVGLILLGVPESAEPADIARIFPGWQTRPINRDPCWGELKALAEKARAELSERSGTIH